MIKPKHFIIATLSLSLCALLVLGSINFIIDPLFQYHKPLFGLQADITDERYQNAGVAKTFDFDNAIIGSSFSENFVVSEFNEAFGGETVKLTMSGGYAPDYNILLNILSEREKQPDKIFLNIDSYYLTRSSTEYNKEPPEYLYDSNPFNDVNYLFNFTILKDYSLGMIKANMKDEIPDYDDAFVWDDGTVCSKSNFSEADMTAEYDEITNIYEYDEAIQLGKDTIAIITKYIELMPDTEFYIYYSPFSMIFWNASNRGGKTDIIKQLFLNSAETLTSYSNVRLFLFNDDEMLNAISDMNNYRDWVHYSKQVSNRITEKMSDNICLIDKNSYTSEINSFFDYIASFDYESLLS